MGNTIEKESSGFNPDVLQVTFGEQVINRDILVLVFEWLSVRDLLPVVGVCRTWYYIYKQTDHMGWKVKCGKEFPSKWLQEKQIGEHAWTQWHQYVEAHAFDPTILPKELEYKTPFAVRKREHSPDTSVALVWRPLPSLHPPTFKALEQQKELENRLRPRFVTESSSSDDEQEKPVLENDGEATTESSVVSTPTNLATQLANTLTISSPVRTCPTFITTATTAYCEFHVHFGDELLIGVTNNAKFCATHSGYSILDSHFVWGWWNRRGIQFGGSSDRRGRDVYKRYFSDCFIGVYVDLEKLQVSIYHNGVLERTTETEEEKLVDLGMGFQFFAMLDYQNDVVTLHRVDTVPPLVGYPVNEPEVIDHSQDPYAFAPQGGLNLDNLEVNMNEFNFG